MNRNKIIHEPNFQHSKNWVPFSLWRWFCALQNLITSCRLLTSASLSSYNWYFKSTFYQHVTYGVESSSFYDFSERLESGSSHFFLSCFASTSIKENRACIWLRIWFGIFSFDEHMNMVEMVLQRMYFICVVCIHKIQMLAEHRLFLTASQSKAKPSDYSKIASWHNISMQCVYVCLKSFPVLIKEHKEKKCIIFHLCFCMCACACVRFIHFFQCAFFQFNICCLVSGPPHSWMNIIRLPLIWW